MWYNVAHSGVLWGNMPLFSLQMAARWGGSVEQMFFGRVQHTIDEKGRLTIPSRHRAELALGLVITRGLDGCLNIYPLETFEEISQKVDSGPKVSQPEFRDFVRYLFAEASDGVPDKQGRILIPTHLREYANLGDEVVVAGVQDHLEVWNLDNYQENRERLEQNPDVIAAGMSRFDIL
jgi:MraZ protein